MNDKLRQLKAFGIAADTIYELDEDNDLYDIVDPWDLGYYDHERFYYEEGISIRRGSAYVPARYNQDFVA